jgi:hypothetical protein
MTNPRPEIEVGAQRLNAVQDDWDAVDRNLDRGQGDQPARADVLVEHRYPFSPR